MSTTPQFSVRFPLNLVAKIDDLVRERQEAFVAASAAYVPSTAPTAPNRTDVILELLREALAAREEKTAAEATTVLAVARKKRMAAKVYEPPTLVELTGAEAATVLAVARKKRVAARKPKKSIRARRTEKRGRR